MNFEVGEICRIADDAPAYCFFEAGSIVQIRQIENNTFFYVKLLIGATKPAHRNMEGNSLCYSDELEHI